MLCIFLADLPSFSGNDGDDAMDVDVQAEEEGKRSRAGTKRSAGSSAANSPKKKPTPVKSPVKSPLKSPPKSSKPVCRYGVKCFQKNKEHQEKFDHPWVGRVLNSYVLVYLVFSVATCRPHS